jgi:hypothetical protein
MYGDTQLRKKSALQYEAWETARAKTNPDQTGLGWTPEDAA